MSSTPPPSKRLHDDEVIGNSSSVANQNSVLGPLGSLKYPHPPTLPPHGKDSSSAGGYPPPPTNVIGPKLTANDHYHHQHHHQIATGSYHQHQQQQPPPKIHRNEPPTTLQQSNERWSTMIPMYHHQQPHHRVPMESHSDRHTLPLETRSEFRDFKGGEKDTSRGRVGDNKELKYHPEYKAETDGWKESKEYYMVDATKRYTDTHVAVQEGTNVEERGYVGSYEDVGENRIDPKGEDRYKDKDRKRKDTKHREWGGERDKDRGERRSSLQLGSGSGEGVKEPFAKEERDVDRWDREKKDPSKDREKPKEREKDPVKRETWTGGPEKDGLNNEKEPMDISGRTPEREASTLEQKKQKDHDGWKSADREGRERRKERDGDVEPERPEKRSRCHDKELDDGSADTDGAMEKDREGFGYGVQQRKRMLRPRGSPLVGNREPRFRSHTQDNEGTQGKPEVSTVVYRVGECMQELIKLWKEYESSQADKNGESSQASPTLEIRIPAEYITATNRQVRGGQLWGTDVYTNDSDLVAVLMHTGYCRPTTSPPPSAIQELRATVRVLPPQDCYTSTLRNNVRSRAWGAAIGCSFRVERCCIFKKGGGSIDLEPCLTHTSTVEPTLAPVAVERTMTTRAAASNALRQQRFVREVTIQYNLCNEPWIKYSLSVVADKGFKKPLYTSARLKKGEVLYMETHSRRYELCFTGEKMVKAAISSQTQEENVEKTQSQSLHAANGEREKSGLTLDGDTILTDVFRWSRCKRPLPQNLLRSSGVPLPSEHLEVLAENLDWEDIRWSQTGVFIAGKEYALARLHFMSPN